MPNEFWSILFHEDKDIKSLSKWRFIYGPQIKSVISDFIADDKESGEYTCSRCGETSIRKDWTDLSQDYTSRTWCNPSAKYMERCYIDDPSSATYTPEFFDGDDVTLHTIDLKAVRKSVFDLLKIVSYDDFHDKSLLYKWKSKLAENIGIISHKCVEFNVALCGDRCIKYELDKLLDSSINNNTRYILILTFNDVEIDTFIAKNRSDSITILKLDDLIDSSGTQIRVKYPIISFIDYKDINTHHADDSSCINSVTNNTKIFDVNNSYTIKISRSDIIFEYQGTIVSIPLRIGAKLIYNIICNEGVSISNLVAIDMDVKCKDEDESDKVENEYERDSHDSNESYILVDNIDDDGCKETEFTGLTTNIYESQLPKIDSKSKANYTCRIKEIDLKLKRLDLCDDDKTSLVNEKQKLIKELADSKCSNIEKSSRKRTVESYKKSIYRAIKQIAKKENNRLDKRIDKINLPKLEEAKNPLARHLYDNIEMSNFTYKNFTKIDWIIQEINE